MGWKPHYYTIRSVVLEFDVSASSRGSKVRIPRYTETREPPSQTVARFATPESDSEGLCELA